MDSIKSVSSSEEYITEVALYKTALDLYYINTSIDKTHYTSCVDTSIDTTAILTISSQAVLNYDDKSYILQNQYRVVQARDVLICKLSLPIYYKPYTLRLYESTCTYYRGKKHSIDDKPSVIDDYGTLSWYKNGKLHRENGPASITANGIRQWFINNKLHSTNDEPSIIYANGDKYWHKEDKLHREGGPAVILANGDQHWYKEGVHHREDDEPATITKDGYKNWVVNGKYHRDGDKPARILPNGKEWWVDGKQVVGADLDKLLSVHIKNDGDKIDEAAIHQLTIAAPEGNIITRFEIIEGAVRVYYRTALINNGADLSGDLKSTL